MPDFALDPRLDADTVPILDLPLSSARLMRDANFPWIILVPRRPGAVEIIDLAADDQALLLDEIGRAARALKAETRCDKLNVAALGNVVAQLHVHVVARFATDPAWPAPVWGQVARCDYAPGAEAALAARLAAAIREA